jgi:CheY-like chemotaxis protein
MDHAALSRLFQPFVQGDGSITRRYGGTGLGLTISRRLVLLMGGDITVTSTPGSGSCFQFELEFAVPALALGTVTEPLPDPESASLGQMASTIAGAHVLLVEDDPVNQHVAARLLERAGLRISVANHGGEALEQLAAAEFDAVLMDLQMPVVDGFEATRQIRAETRWAALPIIAFTAGAMVHDRDKCLAAGMSDFVVKPVQPHQLIAALLRHIAPRHAPTELAATAATAVPPAPTFALNIPKLAATLHQLQQRIHDNEFIANAELTELRELTEPLLETRGAIATRIEAAVSRYDYTTAKTLITGLLAALQVGDRSRTP